MGRPPLSESVPTHKVNLRLEEDLYEMVRILAFHRTNSNISKVFRLIARDYFKRHPVQSAPPKPA